MTRIVVYAIAILEFMLGLSGLSIGSFILSRENSTMSPIFTPVFMSMIPLAVAGPLLFFGKPWSYYVQCVALALWVILFALLSRPMGLPFTSQPFLTVVALATILAIVFALPPIRRHFGVGGSAARVEAVPPGP